MTPTDGDGGVVTQPPVVVSPPVATDDGAPPLSGTIKSYFEDIEREPPLSTGSIFATGFSFETSGWLRRGAHAKRAGRAFGLGNG